MFSIKSLELEYNSYLGYACTVSIDISSGIVRYKNNFCYKSGSFHEQESLLLCNKQEAERFATDSLYILDWKQYYGIGVTIDGQYWYLKIELSDGTTRMIKGENGKPNNFSDFIMSFEQLISKPIEFNSIWDK